MAIFYALVAMVGWAVGDTIIAHTSRKIGNRTAMFWWSVGGAVISSFYIPFAGPVRDWGMLSVAFLLGIVVNTGTLFYFAAFEKGNASITAVIGGSSSLLTVLLAVLFFGEVLNGFLLVGILLITLGLVLASVNMKELAAVSKKGLLSDPAVAPALVAFVMWGIYWAALRIPVERIGWFWPGYAAWFFFPFMPILGLAKWRSVKVLGNPKTFFAIFIMALLTGIAGFAFNLGIEAGYTSVVAPIAGSFPVLLVIFTRIFFKDRLTGTQKIGIATALIGLLLLSFFG